MINRRISIALCLFTICRSYHFHRCPPKFAMSKSIRSFFVSSSTDTTVVTSDGNKRAKKEHVSIAATVSEASEVDSPTPTAAAALAPVPAVETTVDEAAPVDDTKFGWLPFDAMEPGWKASLAPQFNKPYFQSLLAFLTAESKSQTIYPPTMEIFTALNLCPLDKVKVVVIGQDPYHGADQAHGLSFSVRKGVAIPPSLKNMIAEARNDPKVKIPMPTHGNLECWAKQGVLMLNTVLTVRKGDANSHQKKGWENFTDAIVKVLSTRTEIVYLLWGNPAQLKCKDIDGKNNTMITTSHPSPLGAYKTSQPFMGSRCFSRCNEALEHCNKEPIDWTIR